jgi:hypothetical protein
MPPGTSTRAAVQPAQSGLLSCFSYPADVPPVSGDRAAVQPAQCGYLHCFSYPGDVPPGPRRMPAGSACFRY